MADAPTNLLAEYDLLRTACGVFSSPDAALIELTGEDCKSWLQGQVTNDLNSLALGGSQQFCIVEPTGQMLAACQVWSLPGRYLISTQTVCLPAVLKRVEQMVILEDVSAKDLGLQFRLTSVQGPDATHDLSKRMTLPSLDAGLSRIDSVEVLALRNDRSGGGGWDLWLPQEQAAELESAFAAIGPEAQEIARLEAGIPRFGTDMGPKTLPPEMGPHFVSKHISYTKGCYTGQEVMMRIHSRGHINRSWVGLVADAPMQAGNLIHHSERHDAGTVTSAAESPAFGHIAAASVRNEALQGTIVVDTATGPVEARVRDLPFIHGI